MCPNLDRWPQHGLNFASSEQLQRILTEVDQNPQTPAPGTNKHVQGQNLAWGG